MPNESVEREFYVKITIITFSSNFTDFRIDRRLSRAPGNLCPTKYRKILRWKLPSARISNETATMKARIECHVSTSIESPPVGGCNSKTILSTRARWPVIKTRSGVGDGGGRICARANFNFKCNILARSWNIHCDPAGRESGKGVNRSGHEDIVLSYDLTTDRHKTPPEIFRSRPLVAAKCFLPSSASRSVGILNAQTEFK